MKLPNPSFVVLAASFVALAARGEPLPKHELPRSKNGNLVVGMCDGKTSVEVAGVRADQALSPEQGKTVANQLMREWLDRNPSVGTDWKKEELLAQAKAPPAADSRATSQESASSGAKGITTPRPDVQAAQTYGAFASRDEAIWKASTDAFVNEGNRIFHDAKALGGTVAISCDMCHPNAANTHPETYPKYQVQLGRVALLRDMINWCIENPVRGKPLDDGDPKLKAMEAYITAQRKGVPLEHGKH